MFLFVAWIYTAIYGRPGKPHECGTTSVGAQRSTRSRDGGDKSRSECSLYVKQVLCMCWMVYIRFHTGKDRLALVSSLVAIGPASSSV